MSGTHHWGGPIGAVLGHVKAQTKGDICVVSHYGLTYTFAQYMGVRGAGFRMIRFIERSGYNTAAARMMRDEIWRRLPAKGKSKLVREARYLNIVTPWWEQ